MPTKIRSSQQINIDQNFDLNEHKIINLSFPDAPTDAANKQYVDSVAQGLQIKKSVKAAADTNINLAIGAPSTIDGVNIGNGDRILILNQNDLEYNGIYVITDTGNWERAADANSWDKLKSAFVFVEEGNTYSDTGWVCIINDGGELNVDPIMWNQFSGTGTYTGGDGIDVTGTVIRAKLGPGLEFNDGNIRVKLNGNTLTRNSFGLKVTDGTFLSAANNSTQNGYFNDVHLIDDVDGSHYLKLTSGENLTANRTLTIIVNNAHRVLDLGGNIIVGGTLNLGGSLVSDNNVNFNGSPVQFNVLDGETEVSLPQSGKLISTDTFTIETPDGDIDGENQKFELTRSTSENGDKIMVFRNGLLQKYGDDFVMLGVSRIEFSTPPEEGDKIAVMYV